MRTRTLAAFLITEEGLVVDDYEVVLLRSTGDRLESGALLAQFLQPALDLGYDPGRLLLL